MPPVHELAPRPTQDTGHMLARPKPLGEGGLLEGRHPSHVGPLIGAAIIIILLGFGALYFYGDYLNKQNSQQQLPLIEGDAVQ